MVSTHKVASSSLARYATHNYLFTSHQTPTKMKLNPYKTGFYFYVIFIIGIALYLGYDRYSDYKKDKELQKEVEEIFNYPNLTTPQH
jgi:hypothetical protein